MEFLPCYGEINNLGWSIFLNKPSKCLNLHHCNWCEVTNVDFISLVPEKSSMTGEKTVEPEQTSTSKTVTEEELEDWLDSMISWGGEGYQGGIWAWSKFWLPSKWGWANLPEYPMLTCTVDAYSSQCLPLFLMASEYMYEACLGLYFCRYLT